MILDRPEGVTLQDCETVSRQVSALLDVVDYGIGKYVLEVSSPGLDRELYRPADYSRFSGRLVRVTWQSPQMANKRTVVGRLEAFDPQATNSERQESGGNENHAGIVTVIEAQSEERLEIPLSDIKTTRLEIDE